MSQATDVEFMALACARISRNEPSVKAQAWAVTRALGVSGNRAYEFLKGRVKRVDGFEKDRAREAIQQLEAENERRENTKHLAWLQTTLAAMGEGDAEFYRPQIDALERVLRTKGGVDSAVVNSKRGE